MDTVSPMTMRTTPRCTTYPPYRRWFRRVMVASARQEGSPAISRRARTARAVSKTIPAATSTQSVRASSG